MTGRFRLIAGILPFGINGCFGRLSVEADYHFLEHKLPFEKVVRVPFLIVSWLVRQYSLEGHCIDLDLPHRSCPTRTSPPWKFLESPQV